MMQVEALYDLEPRSGLTFTRILSRKSINGRLVLLMTPVISAPICRKKSITQITTNVTQFASYKDADVWITARTPKKAAMP
ncbi:hypothetical protein D3C85_1576650 [compost metagenome]